ncbi:MAG: FAD-dependent oxidoreductase [Rhodospirillaceae bacterium]|jgi:2,4-dienoyl-CoA reductase-like NADH-dependent reductase (Old Yellow Enzyme family)/thioredoxin reductase|nr:FAD-dependent oxidoreductase [Rhodospirillaceae bacterium]MBT6511639.1 FAD-dependent oxidoreductase [Rhodospirillaceae bacterium]MBT7614311.1 FAD-dependent oxidoreductase [Rhodospirillaceae bacterium]
MTGFPNLFSPITVGSRTFRNRIFSTGHMTCLLNDDLVPDERFVAYHESRARGGAGLIIMEAARIHETGGHRNLDVSSDDAIPGLRRVGEAVQKHCCAIFGQLGHSGAYGVTTGDGSLGVSYAPSQAKSSRSHNISRELPLSLIHEYVAAYGSAGGRMKKAGLDGVEILASHALLPAQFLNPAMNWRTDAYGGSLENRMRFLREIIASVRDNIGPNTVLGLRISADELQEEGNSPDELLEVCRLVGNEGALDYLNVIAGSMIGLKGSIHVVPPMNIEAGYLAPHTEAVKKLVPIPVFVAGRINQPQEAERVLKSGQADMIGMTRAQIADPEMANKAREGRLDDIRACIACNQACIGHMQMGIGISCIQRPETGRELDYEQKPKTTSPRTVLVAGGGPAGMKAAAVAAERGHKVILCEASPRLGGQALLAQELPGRAEFGGIVTNLAHEMQVHGVEVRMETQVTLELIKSIEAGAVILATGATPHKPALEGQEDAHVVDAWQVIRGEANVGGRVVIADWRCDWVGLGLAEKLARDGCKVTLAVNGYTPGQMIQMYVRDRWIGDLHKLGVEIIPYARLFGADATSAYLQHVTSGEAIIVDDVDTVVTAMGHLPVTVLADALEDWSGDVLMAGDCLSPRTCEEAVLEGMKAGFEV